jgi:hypothetical protein
MGVSGYNPKKILSLDTLNDVFKNKITRVQFPAAPLITDCNQLKMNGL